MRKPFVIAALIAILVLSACSPATASQTAVISTPALPLVTSLVTPTTLASASAVTPSPTPEPTNVIVPSGPATCQPSPVVPTPDPNAKSYLPDVSASDWVKGADNAKVTIIEYADFQDANSAKLAIILQQLLDKYPQDVRLVFRHFPLSEQYDKDTLAAQAAEAAGLQGKFWQYHNLLFNDQADWVNLPADQFTAWAVEKASEIDLNADQFKTDMNSDAIVARVNASRTVVVKLNTVYTNFYDPFLFFNGATISMLYNLDTLSETVEFFKLPDKSYTQCPPMTVDQSKSYTATIHTDKGDIVIQLYADKAPWAVNSFVFLAQSGWYDGSAFYRVIPGFVAQAGDPSNSGLGSPGYSFSDEFVPDLRFDKPGVVGMANAGANTNGSQFFITYTAIPSWDGKYTVFGQVISGMDVLAKLRPRNPKTDAILLPPDPINSITIEVK